MEDKLENLQALIEGSGLGDVRQKVRGMSEARVLWVLDGYKIDGLPSGREFFIEWDSLVLLQCLFDRFGSVFPQCGLMVFPGVVIVSR